jgi:hypothetical protein
MSPLVADTLHVHRQLVVELMIDLLLYAQLQFRKDPDGFGRSEMTLNLAQCNISLNLRYDFLFLRVSTCERYLGYLLAIRQILAKDHQYVVAVDDFGNTERAKLLRDRLVHDDLMDLAAQVGSPPLIFREYFFTAIY